MSTTNPLVKVCGVRDAAQAKALLDAGADLVGFNFHPASVRYVGDALDADAVRALRSKDGAIRTVGVFVDRPVEEVRAIAQRYALDAVQLHGHESPAVCAALRKEVAVIKAFTAGPDLNDAALSAYADTCTYYLFDAPGALRGGNGHTFPWTRLSRYTGNTPFLLAGGIAPEHAEALQRFQHSAFRGVDINSRFETAPGVKDLPRVAAFIGALRTTIPVQP